MEYAVETFSLTKIFSDWWGRNKVYAVEDLNLKIQYNEVFGLLGPNGSGKTTTIKMLLGLLHPTRGKALCLGGDSKNPKINCRIGFLPEESYLYRYLTARETLDFYGRLFALPAKVRKMRIEALLDMVGLKAMANRPVGTFSKGMARRIGLAQALINDPDLLILDEPTTGLDPIGTRQIKDVILELSKRGKTILLCSHLLADVEDVCDRISILYGGKVRAEGKVKDLLQQTDKRQITTGTISEATVEKIRQLVDSEQADFLINSPMEKLETFFINTVFAAQQQQLPTSGAVSTTEIGDFLMSETDEKSRRDAILDKLTSAPVSKESERPSVKTQKTDVRAELLEKESGKELLDKLTKPDRTSTIKTQSVEKKDQAEVSDEVRKNVLENLTDTDSQSSNKKQTGAPEGDSSDA